MLHRRTKTLTLVQEVLLGQKRVWCGCPSFAAIPSMETPSQAKRENIAARCIAAFSVGGFIAPIDLISAGDRFMAWIEGKYPGAEWYTATFLTSPCTDGGQWIGTIDLLLQLPSGGLVVIDHKSAPIRRDHCSAKAAT